MKRKRTGTDYLINIILMLVAIVMILPFYNVLITSFADPAAVVKQQFYLIPTSFNVSSYKILLDGSYVGKALMNSLIVTVLGTSVNMVVTTCGAYALSKKSMPGRSIMMAGIVFTMLFSGGLIPFYLTIKGLHLINNYGAMIYPVAVSTFFLIVMINHFRSIPPSLEESAKIDGANDLYILYRIVLPISKPTMAAITLFYAVARWNEWYNAMLFMTDTNKHPMQLFLRNMLADVTRMSRDDMGAAMMSQLNQSYPDGIKMASVIITIVPVMMVYPFLQRHFSAGVTLGAVKE